jgi:hypothetical protein
VLELGLLELGPLLVWESESLGLLPLSCAKDPRKYHARYPQGSRFDLAKYVAKIN